MKRNSARIFGNLSSPTVQVEVALEVNAEEVVTVMSREVVTSMVTIVINLVTFPRAESIGSKEEVAIGAGRGVICSFGMDSMEGDFVILQHVGLHVLPIYAYAKHTSVGSSTHLDVIVPSGTWSVFRPCHVHHLQRLQVDKAEIGNAAAADVRCPVDIERPL